MASANRGGGTREVPQRVADELRALIVSGELADGASLGREPDLVERFGVSRPSLREALRILEAEGLITVERGLPVSWLDDYPKVIRAISLDQVNAAIRKHIDPDKMVLVEAGSLSSGSGAAK